MFRDSVLQFQNKIYFALLYELLGYAKPFTHELKNELISAPITRFFECSLG